MTSFSIFEKESQPTRFEIRDCRSIPIRECANMDIQWIIEGLERSGKTRVQLAQALGRSPSVVTKILNGDRELKAREIAVIANFLGVPAPAAITKPSPFESENPTLSQLEVVGEVAAGVWQEPEADSFESYYVDVPFDPRFPEQDQYLLKVRGSSINRRAASGSLVRCLKVHAAPRRPSDGDWVIALRMRHGSAETTVKRLEVKPDKRQMLWPDSTDPTFQEPIEVGQHDGDEVFITAFVLDFINPATRF